MGAPSPGPEGGPYGFTESQGSLDISCSPTLLCVQGLNSVKVLWLMPIDRRTALELHIVKKEIQKTNLQKQSVLWRIHFAEYAKNGYSIHSWLTNENSGLLHQASGNASPRMHPPSEPC